MQITEADIVDGMNLLLKIKNLKVALNFNEINKLSELKNYKNAKYIESILLI